MHFDIEKNKKIMTESQINVHGISPNAVNDIGPNDFVNNYHLEDVIRHEERQHLHNQKMRIREAIRKQNSFVNWNWKLVLTIYRGKIAKIQSHWL